MINEAFPKSLATPISLAGEWEYRLDPACVPFDSEPPDGTIKLPGSLDTNGVGAPYRSPEIMTGLARRVYHVGPVWLRRNITIPHEWSHVDLEIYLERVHWFGEVWVNGVCVGAHDSLSVPQTYQFSTKGETELTISLRIDNTPHIPIGRISHALTEWTQTNWNGVIGQMVLRPAPTTTVRTFSTLNGLQVQGTAPRNEELSIRVGQDSYQVLADSEGEYKLLIPLSTIEPWSERNPALTIVEVADISLRTGYRQFQAKGRFFELNGESVFLRGTLECCVFPLTGFPPTDVGSWQAIMDKVKEYGLNHIRFHSWCPPEAAFSAADEAGILLQVELPLWTGHWPLGSDPVLLDFCRREAFKILEAYGHHPSFVLFTLGNEMSLYGPEPEVDSLLKELKVAFPHILMNFSSHGTHLSPECDYYVQADNAKSGADNRPLRGSTWFGVGSRFDRESPTTTTTCDEAAAAYDRPVMAHEVGEWAVFPNVNAEQDYRGVLRADNFARIRQGLQDRGMEDQADQFTFASGKLSAMLYKEEIETLLRTQQLAGFQLLGLTDFPGQGTATVGMLDAFWKEKGFVTGDEFRRFCGPTIPLMITPKFVWTTEEILSVEIRAFHIGASVQADVHWSFAGIEGRFTGKKLTACDPNPIGSISVDLRDVQPGKHILEVSLDGLGQNSWPLWIFASAPARVPLSEVQVFEYYRQDVRQALGEGKTVWLRLNPYRIWTGLDGRFAPAFWSPIHFQEQVGTMGAVIQDDSPLFSGFPTESFSEWHWWEILRRSKALCLNALPREYRPELQIIDRYERNHKLGTIVTGKVGKGRLLMTCIDFDTPGRPAAASLENSIRTHLVSDAFDPKQVIPIESLDEVFALCP